VFNVDIKNIKKVERKVYPSYMRYLQSCNNLEDVADYLECSPDQVVVLQGENWYLLASIDEDSREMEIADLASIGKFNPFIITKLAHQYKGFEVTMDLRKTTSYPLLMKLAQWKKWNIIHDELWMWEEEEFHEVVMRF
jgi:hypothetical protein